MQYTIRKVPKRLDQALRQRARTQNKSLNQVAIETLERALGIAEEPVRHRDLGDLAGKWVEDPDFEQAVADQDRVDEAHWK
jgi:plasmid stability protein